MSVKKTQEFGRNFEELRRNLDLTQKEAAQILGVTDTTIGNWERGENTPPDPSRRLEELRNSDFAQKGDAIYNTEASAGDGSFKIEEEPSGHMPASQSLSRPGLDVYWIKVRGDSMGDKYQKHTFIPIEKFDPTWTDIAQDDVYLFRLEGAVQIKRLQRIEGDRILIISDNDAYENRTLALDDGIDFEILGRVLV
jgi:phage repressor protein C with HTH and peptisase S24 domain